MLLTAPPREAANVDVGRVCLRILPTKRPWPIPLPSPTAVPRPSRHGPVNAGAEKGSGSSGKPSVSVTFSTLCRAVRNARSCESWRSASPPNGIDRAPVLAVLNPDAEWIISLFHPVKPRAFEPPLSVKLPGLSSPHSLVYGGPDRTKPRGEMICISLRSLSKTCFR